MKPLAPDMSIDAQEVLFDLIRQSPVWKRLQMVADLNQTLRLLALADLRRRYPHATEEDLRRRLAARLLKREEVIAAYGWDPAIESSMSSRA
jgi:histidinol-phosphate/aromatic aminotransferase/cobyric acid decarboxylase-like protein